MTRLLSAKLAADIQRRTQEGAYGDTANYIARTTSSSDSYGQPTYSTTSTAITCSFTDRPARERWADYADIGAVEAEIRFASPAPNKADYITLTGHFDDSAYVDKTYEIIGIRNRGALGYVCALRAVEL